MEPAELVSGGEALEQAMDRFSEETGITEVCSFTVRPGDVSLKAPKTDGEAGLDYYVVEPRSHRLWADGPSCRDELFNLDEVDMTVVSGTYNRLMEEAGLSAEDLDDTHSFIHLVRDVETPSTILIVASVSTVTYEDYTRIETLDGTHIETTAPEK